MAKSAPVRCTRHRSRAASAPSGSFSEHSSSFDGLLVKLVSTPRTYLATEGNTWQKRLTSQTLARLAIKACCCSLSLENGMRGELARTLSVQTSRCSNCSADRRLSHLRVPRTRSSCINCAPHSGRPVIYSISSADRSVAPSRPFFLSRCLPRLAHITACVIYSLNSNSIQSLGWTVRGFCNVFRFWRVRLHNLRL